MGFRVVCSHLMLDMNHTFDQLGLFDVGSGAVAPVKLNAGEMVAGFEQYVCRCSHGQAPMEVLAFSVSHAVGARAGVWWHILGLGAGVHLDRGEEVDHAA
jgi:hypothetical protein